MRNNLEALEELVNLYTITYSTLNLTLNQIIVMYADMTEKLLSMMMANGNAHSVTTKIILR